MDDWIFGCDICQEVCPHNQPTIRTRHAAVNPAYSPHRDGFDLLEVLGWDEEARQLAFLRSSMKRAKLPMMKRNALIAAGNLLQRQEHPDLLARISSVAANPAEDDLVRQTASEVLQRVRSRATSERLRLVERTDEHQKAEQDRAKDHRKPEACSDCDEPEFPAAQRSDHQNQSPK